MNKIKRLLLCLLTLCFSTSAVALTLSEALLLSESGINNQILALEKQINAINSTPLSFGEQLYNNTQIALNGASNGSKNNTSLLLNMSTNANPISHANLSFNLANPSLSLKVSFNLFPPKSNQSAKQSIPLLQENELNITKQFFSVLACRLELPIKEKTWQLGKENLLVSEKNYSLGLISFSDYKEAVQNEQLKQQEVIELQTKLNEAESSLETELGCIELDTLIYNFSYEWPTLDTLNVDTRLIEQLEEPLRITKEELHKLKQNKKPQLGTSIDLSANKTSFNYGVLLEFSQTLFNPSLAKQIQKTELELQKQELLFTQKKEALYAEAKLALQAYSKSRQAWLKAKENLADATKMHQLANEGYQKGLVSPKELKISLIEQELALLNVQNAHMECALKYLNLKRWEPNLPVPSL
mgnify:FL=1